MMVWFAPEGMYATLTGVTRMNPDRFLKLRNSVIQNFGGSTWYPNLSSAAPEALSVRKNL